MPLDQPLEAAAGDEVPEPGTVLGTGCPFDEPDDLPRDVKCRMRRFRVVGENQRTVRPEDPESLAYHERPLVFRVLVQGEQEQARVERSVRERKLERRAADVLRVRSTPSLGCCDHRLGEIEPGGMDPCPTERSALRTGRGGDVEDVTSAEFPADPDDLRP